VLTLVFYILSPAGEWFSLTVGSGALSMTGNLQTTTIVFGGVVRTTKTDAEWVTYFDSLGLSRGFLSKQAGAGCVIFVIILNTVLMGVAITNTIAALRKVRANLVKRSEDNARVGCCGSSGCGISDPCVGVACIATAFGISVPVGSISWPASIGTLWRDVIIFGGYTGFSGNSFSVLAGYDVFCIAMVLQMVSLILHCIARDKLRAFLFSGGYSSSSSEGGGSQIIVVTPNPVQSFPAPQFPQQQQQQQQQQQWLPPQPHQQVWQPQPMPQQQPQHQPELMMKQQQWQPLPPQAPPPTFAPPPPPMMQQPVMMQQPQTSIITVGGGGGVSVVQPTANPYGSASVVVTNV
jgi:hypothetical protein